jgi:small GTP-binding protein
MEADFLFKIVVVGDPSVGKSGLLERFTNNNFNSYSKSTIGVMCLTYIMKIGDKTAKMALWDTVYLN